MSLPAYEKLQEIIDVEVSNDAPETKQNNSDLSCAEVHSTPLSPPPSYDFTRPSVSQIHFPSSRSNENHIQNYPPYREQVAAAGRPSAIDVLFSGDTSRPSPPNRSQNIDTTNVTPGQQERYATHMLFSCLVFWCCGVSGWVFGLIAFVLAMIASDKSYERGHQEEASKMGKCSIGFSIAGAVLGIVLTIIICVIYI